MAAYSNIVAVYALLATVAAIVALWYARRATLTSCSHEHLEESIRASTEDLRNANAELRQMNAALDGFTYAASHDLQEPLRTLVAFSQLLERDLGGELNGRVRDDLHHIQTAARRMQGLIKDLLALSRKPDSDLRLGPVPVGRCVDEALDAVRVALAERCAVVTRAPMPDAVCADRLLLTQVYQNLLSNAIKFVPPERQPAIHLTARRNGAFWELGVKDNGIGIDRSFTETIFLPFKRLGTLRGASGSGVGLALCRNAITLLGGRVWVESTPGEGTHAIFTVPAAT